MFLLFVNKRGLSRVSPQCANVDGIAFPHRIPADRRDLLENSRGLVELALFPVAIARQQQD